VDKEDIVRKWYNKLFRLPSIPRALIYNLLVAFSASILRSLPGFEALPLNILRYVSGTGIYVLLLYLTIGFKNSLIGFRRSLGVALFSQAVMIPVEVMTYWGKTYGLMYSCSAGLIMIISFTASGARSILSVVAPVAGGLVAQKDLTYLTIHIYTALTSLLVSLIYIFIVGLHGLRMGVKPFKLVKGFLSAWATDNPQIIEDIFSENASRESIDATIFRLNGLNGGVALVNPSIHFGPFKDVGSSKFIHYLEEGFGDNCRVIVFHTPCSHDRNIAKSQTARSIALKLSSAIKDGEGYEEINLQRIYRLTRNGWSFFTLKFSSGLLLFIHNYIDGNDDLPYELQILAETCKEDLNLKFIQTVDSHSFKGVGDLDVNTLTSSIREIVQSIHSSTASKVMAGYGEAVVEGYCRGICKNVVKALALKIGDETYLIVYIYGNNMDGEYRRKLAETLKNDFKIADIEITTPDDHSCAATSVESPYYIVRENPHLTEAVRKAAEKSLNNMSTVNIEFKKVVFSNVELMGGYVWKLLEALEKIGGKASKLLFTVIISIYVLTYIFTLLIQ